MREMKGRKINKTKKK